MIAVDPHHKFTEIAQEQGLSTSEILNFNNNSPSLPENQDVVVAGGGIHGLIYAIHAKCFDPSISVTVVEKSSKPGYKIGESTLPLFSLWCKMMGLNAEVLLRIFGLKDGLCFYFLDAEDPERYTDFCSNGTPCLFLSGYQIERSISELLFTVYAQRHGVNVFHGHSIDIQGTKLSGTGNFVQVVENKSKVSKTIASKYLVDATGRFRQFASKEARIKRFDGWNVNAYWGYFTCKDETKIPLRFFEGDHTNHLCFPEGWAWVIRMPSWEGSPIPNLMDMINYLLDHAENKTPGDEIPSSEELAKMFDLKLQWIFSIGFAVRDDARYPDDLTPYGTKEAEQKFNYWVHRYPMISRVMENYKLIENPYGPNTTWFVRKQLAFQSPKVSGPGWFAIGDAVGFTNPLHSPGINASMSTSTYAAELTHKALATSDPEKRLELFKPYEDFCDKLIPSLHQMNKFNYVCFRHPELGPQVSTLWQFLAGIGIPGWQLIRQDYNLTFATYVDHSKNWAWGSQVPEYVTVAKKAIELLDGPLYDPVPIETVNELIEFSNAVKREAVASNRFNFRWNGLLRYYDLELNYLPEKTWKDRFSRMCEHCGSWVASRPDWRKCYTCGKMRKIENCQVEWNPKLEVHEVAALVRASDAKATSAASGPHYDAVGVI
ncbi:uncharacterized protein VTP21DRAFT_7469 [Calcarisporiella thermophila]|uniref:uncharacterized protein n=1 Tax=Calcarisporiella thermophila TaxID=911321 RepID=UPI003742648D